MALTLMFVDSMSATTPRLNLHNPSSRFWNLKREGTSFGYPELRRVLVDSMLYDGARSPASSYGPRMLTLNWLVETDDPDLTAAELQKLYRELDRPPMTPGGPNNLLKYQQNTSQPIWFRTFRSGPEQVDVINDGGLVEITASILAEPFALGALQTVSGLQVTNDPAAANKPWVDLTAGQVLGDVETPAIIKVTAGTAVNGHELSAAVRRHGTPANGTYFMQCESLTLGTDTTLPGADAAMSGAGSNYARCSFGTNANAVDRLSGNFPSTGTQSVDMRGKYNVWLVCRASTSTASVFGVRFGWGQTTAVYGGSVARSVSTSSTGKRLINLGEINFPIGSDPVYDGYGGTLLTHEQTFIRVQASRSSGPASLDFDTLIFVPSDEETAYVKMSSDADRPVLDGVHDAIWSHTAGVIQTGAPNEFRGGKVPMLTPNQINRLFFLTKVEDSTHVLTDGVTFDVSYYPRYIGPTRPASS